VREVAPLPAEILDPVMLRSTVIDHARVRGVRDRPAEAAAVHRVGDGFIRRMRMSPAKPRGVLRRERPGQLARERGAFGAALLVVIGAAFSLMRGRPFAAWAFPRGRIRMWIRRNPALTRLS